MSLTDDDIRWIRAELKSYVSREECEAKNDEVQKTIASLDKNMSVMVAKQEVTNKLVSKLVWTAIGALISAVASGIITLITK